MSQNALVTATYSQRMRLQLEDGSAVTARIKGKRLRPVCGDKVEAEPLSGESEWLITAILPRENELTRPTSRGSIEILASNLSCIAVVASVLPEPDWFIVDRYLAAAEVMHASALVVFNKTDLDETNPPELTTYEDIGYGVFRTSASDGNGIDQLAHALTDQTSIVVGQSGVGKSSIINALISDDRLKTGTVSASSREGRHTTVNSELIELASGGAVIDSPGVRDYAPALSEITDVAIGFREITAAAENCRFANCRHLREPGCAVKDGVDGGTIDPRRYESYRRLLSLTQRLNEDRY